MKALKIEPGKAPERIDVANELASLQSLVGGYIEVIYPDERRPVGLICNEEGKCCGLGLKKLVAIHSQSSCVSKVLVSVMLLWFSPPFCSAGTQCRDS